MTSFWSQKDSTASPRSFTQSKLLGTSPSANLESQCHSYHSGVERDPATDSPSLSHILGLEGVQPPAWAPRRLAKSCGHCRSSLLGRLGQAHNCRLCGKVFCSKCTKKYDLPPRFAKKAKKGPQRVCLLCRNIYLPPEYMPESSRVTRSSEETGITFILPPHEFASPATQKKCADCQENLFPSNYEHTPTHRLLRGDSTFTEFQYDVSRGSVATNAASRRGSEAEPTSGPTFVPPPGRSNSSSLSLSASYEQASGRRSPSLTFPRAPPNYQQTAGTEKSPFAGHSASEPSSVNLLTKQEAEHAIHCRLCGDLFCARCCVADERVPEDAPGLVPRGQDTFAVCLECRFLMFEPTYKVQSRTSSVTVMTYRTVERTANHNSKSNESANNSPALVALPPSSSSSPPRHKTFLRDSVVINSSSASPPENHFQIGSSSLSSPLTAANVSVHNCSQDSNSKHSENLLQVPGSSKAARKLSSASSISSTFSDGFGNESPTDQADDSMPNSQGINRANNASPVTQALAYSTTVRTPISPLSNKPPILRNTLPRTSNVTQVSPNSPSTDTPSARQRVLPRRVQTVAAANKRAVPPPPPRRPSYPKPAGYVEAPRSNPVAQTRSTAVAYQHRQSEVHDSRARRVRTGACTRSQPNSVEPACPTTTECTCTRSCFCLWAFYSSWCQASWPVTAGFTTECCPAEPSPTGHLALSAWLAATSHTAKSAIISSQATCTTCSPSTSFSPSACDHSALVPEAPRSIPKGYNTYD